MQQSHAQLIDALGGGTAIALALAADGILVDRESVYKWRQNGVPWKWRSRLAAVAAARGVPVPTDFLPGVLA